MNIHLYTANHKALKGIEDYIYALKNIFNSEENSFTLVDKVTNKADLLIVIEDFTNNFEKVLEDLKKAKSLSIRTYLVHTEFPNEKFFLNIFTKKELLFRNLILSNVILKLNTLRSKNTVFLLPLSIILLFYGLISFCLFFEIKNLKSRIYFAIRDKALKRILYIFDHHISLSEDLTKCLNRNFSNFKVFTLYPLIDEDFIEKIKNTNNNLVLSYFSGNFTSYRKRLLRKIRLPRYNFIFREKKNTFFSKKSIDINFFKSQLAKIKLFKVNLIFMDIIYLEENIVLELKEIFKNYINESLLIIELYISQRKNWPYLSPMRIIRSTRNGFIPLNIGNYKSILLDKVCINIKDFLLIDKDIDKVITDYKSNIKSSVQEYNYIASKNNQAVLKNL